MLFLKKIFSIILINKSYFILIAILFFLSCDHSYSNKDLIGVWSGYYMDKHITIVFEEKNFQQTIEDQKNNKSENFNGIYSVNFTKKPIPLSFKNISNLNHPLYTTIYFKDNNTIKMTQFSQKWRLRIISFDDSFIAI